MKITVSQLRAFIREALGVPTAPCRACSGKGSVTGEFCAACSGTGEEIDPNAGGARD